MLVNTKEESVVDVREYKKVKIVVATVVGICLLICFVAVCVNVFGKKPQEEKKEIITESTLEKIINVSELSTYEAVYNGVLAVMNEKKAEEVDYYVYYEAKVKAGINIEEIEVEVNNEEKRVSIALPEVHITDTEVKIESLEFMFYNNKAETETVSQEAYKKCIADVKKESASENKIYELARSNARNFVEALVNPFVQQLDSEYVIEIN